jgi:hypothetical protein
MRSLWPYWSSPSPKITIGVTAIIVIMTMEAKMSKVMVDKERKLMRRLDLMLTVQFLLI